MYFLQLGVALGFLLPPILVPTLDNSTIDDLAAHNLTEYDVYGKNLATMFYGSAAFNGLMFLVVLLGG